MISDKSKLKTLSVSQITDLIKEQLEGIFPYVIIEGEISNYRPSSTGHVYFTLKDENAAISAVMFKGKARSVSFNPKDGMRVSLTGSISVYAQRGTYQIVVDTMELAGVGDILRLLEERKQKLAAEGLFNSEHKKQLPQFPKTIGVITSQTGAALRDILNVVKRRNNGVSVVVLPAVVQGADAAVSIERQIIAANEFNLADVLIVGRGGGSLEDLLPFSEENVVRAIFLSEIPVISAVGHEIDWALSDFVADLRAPTPSAAAEIATPLKDELINYIKNSLEDLETSIETRVERMRLTVRSFSIEAMELRFRAIEQPLLQRFDDAKEALLVNSTERIHTLKTKLSLLTQKIEDANPKAIMARGFSVVRNKTTGAIIRKVSDVKQSDMVEIIPANGIIDAVVTSVKNS